MILLLFSFHENKLIVAIYPFRLANVYAITVGFKDGTLDGDADGACVGFAVG